MGNDLESQPVGVARTHLLCATIFGALVIAGLFWLGQGDQRKGVVTMAMIAGVCGYLSQLAGANWIWSGEPVWRGVMVGMIVTAIAAWLIGFGVYLFA